MNASPQLDNVHHMVNRSFLHDRFLEADVSGLDLVTQRTCE